MDGVVLTHLHADRTGNLALFPRARVITGEGNWPSSVVTAKTSPILIPMDPVGSSEPLVPGLRIVCLPGHTPGHIGVKVAVGAESHLVVGDAIFDVD
ncbi:MAG: MBL fold metallo-hydrolase [Myxococcota bacterium]